MTKAELIERISRSRDLPPTITKKDISIVLGLAFDELGNYFARAKVTKTNTPRFTFPHFGTFTKKRRSARNGVNPRTLEPIQIEAAHTLDFKASRELKEAMNGSRPAAPSKTVASKQRAEKMSASEESAPTSPTGRRLTPRDEDAELDALIDDDALFEDTLPDAPMQRVRGARKTSVRSA